MASFMRPFESQAYALFRIVTGLLFLWHGSQKLFGYPIPLPPGAEGPLIVIAGVIEFFGGLLILVGLFTRPAAFLISGLMAAAYFMAHAPSEFFPIANQGELAAIYSFLYLYFTFAGGGDWSLDSLVWRPLPKSVVGREVA